MVWAVFAKISEILVQKQIEPFSDFSYTKVNAAYVHFYLAAYKSCLQLNVKVG